MVKKIKKYLKFVVCCALIMSLVTPSYAALSASDGSAFVTKAEFDAALADFNARLTTFEAGINSKIDSQVTSYLDRNGIWNGKSQTLNYEFMNTWEFQLDDFAEWKSQVTATNTVIEYFSNNIRNKIYKPSTLIGEKQQINSGDTGTFTMINWNSASTYAGLGGVKIDLMGNGSSHVQAKKVICNNINKAGLASATIYLRCWFAPIVRVAPSSAPSTWQPLALVDNYATPIINYKNYHNVTTGVGLFGPGASRWQNSQGHSISTLASFMTIDVNGTSPAASFDFGSVSSEDITGLSYGSGKLPFHEGGHVWPVQFFVDKGDTVFLTLDFVYSNSSTGWVAFIGVFKPAMSTTQTVNKPLGSYVSEFNLVSQIFDLKVY